MRAWPQLTDEAKADLRGSGCRQALNKATPFEDFAASRVTSRPIMKWSRWSFTDDLCEAASGARREGDTGTQQISLDTISQRSHELACLTPQLVASGHEASLRDAQGECGQAYRAGP